MHYVRSLSHALHYWLRKLWCVVFGCGALFCLLFGLWPIRLEVHARTAIAHGGWWLRKAARLALTQARLFDLRHLNPTASAWLADFFAPSSNSGPSGYAGRSRFHFFKRSCEWHKTNCLYRFKRAQAFLSVLIICARLVAEIFCSNFQTATESVLLTTEAVSGS
jgi:hypothetical protein